LILFLEYIRKRNALPYEKLLYYFIPLIVGFPLSNALGNGQFSVVVLILVYFSWVNRENPYILSFFLFILFSKYSFGLPIMFGFFLMGYYRSILYAILLIILFPFIYSFMFDLDFKSTVLLPFQVANQTIGIGKSDIMSLSKLLIEDRFSQILFIVFFNLIFVVTLFVLTISKKVSELQIFLCSLIFSFIGFFHLSYDWVVLILLIFFLENGVIKNLFYSFILILFTYPRFNRFLGIEIFNGVSPVFLIVINISVFSFLFFYILYESKKNPDPEIAISNSGPGFQNLELLT
jgi:hypothetical protein